MSDFNDLVSACVKANAELGACTVEMLLAREELQRRLDSIVDYCKNQPMSDFGGHICKLATNPAPPARQPGGMT